MPNGSSGIGCQSPADSFPVDSKFIPENQVFAAVLIACFCLCSWSKQIIEHEREQASKNGS